MITGIITKARNAKEATENAEEEEKIRLAVLGVVTKRTSGDLEENLKEELNKYFGEDGYEISPGENNGEDGFIVTIKESGNKYFIDEDGNVLKGEGQEVSRKPGVTHKITENGDKVIITIKATAAEGNITKITKPDGTSVENVEETTYEVTENGEYKFTVEQSNGGTTEYIVNITTIPESNEAKVGEIVQPGEGNKEYTSGEYTAIIPEGFMIVPGCENIEEGLVISDNSTDTEANSSEIIALGNQFVWIPVTSEAEYVRNGNYEVVDLSASAYTDNDYLPEGIETTGGGMANETAEKSAVVSKGGFYISRYEAGNDGSNNLISKDGATVWINISQADSKSTAKTFINNDNVKSAICSGIQWDMAMKFIIENDADYDVTTATSNWHTASSIVASGQNKEDKACNIYDLESNAFEYVAERNAKSIAYPYDTFIDRGGSYNVSYQASYRSNDSEGKSLRQPFLPFRTLCNVELKVKYIVFIK